MNRLVSPALLLGMLVAVGCGKAAPQFESRPTFPVQGTVLIRGKPEAGVQVFFHPLDSSQQGKPRGVTDAQGHFQLRTYHDGDGAPSGEYKVTLYWPEQQGSSASAEEKLPPDRLGQRFIDIWKSPLRATVADGPTTLAPFKID